VGQRGTLFGGWFLRLFAVDWHAGWRVRIASMTRLHRWWYIAFEIPGCWIVSKHVDQYVSRRAGVDGGFLALESVKTGRLLYEDYAAVLFGNEEDKWHDHSRRRVSSSGCCSCFSLVQAIREAHHFLSSMMNWEHFRGWLAACCEPNPVEVETNHEETPIVATSLCRCSRRQALYTTTTPGRTWAFENTSMGTRGTTREGSP